MAGGFGDLMSKAMDKDSRETSSLMGISSTSEAAAKPPSKKKAKPVSEPLVKKKRKGKQARDRAKEAAKVSAAYLAAKAAGKGAAAPSEPTPTLRMRGLPFSATTDDISGMRPSDRTPD